MGKKKADAAATPATAADGAVQTAPAAPKAEKPAKVEQNGVTRPSSGATLKVWELADNLSAAAGKPAERKEVTEAGLAAGLVVGTIHTQYGRWRKFHGLSVVREKSAAAAAPAAEATPAADAPAAPAEAVAAQ